jgi:predicted metal-dependent phosphoesterase TrpH
MIDLHVHSTESDGTFTPEQIVRFAKEEGIDTVALCDHDTTSGVESFIYYAGKIGITAIPGIEISAVFPKGNCHILGLNIPLHCKPLESILQKYRDSRNQRNALIIDKLCKLGITISVNELKNFASGISVGRPHIAQLLVEKKAALSIDDAFRRYLIKGAAAYVERFRLNAKEIVTLLKKSGATVVLAHPGLINISKDELLNFIVTLKNSGLDALEIFTPHNTDEQIILLKELANKMDLKCSGGSDFHGAKKPDNRMGYYRHDSPVPECIRNVIDLNRK